MKLTTIIFSYTLCWFLATWILDPAVPYDAVEALNWATNAEWGSPKNPWLPGTVMLPLVSLPLLPVNVYWYAIHFIAVGVGLSGGWHLAFQVRGSRRLAWFALLSYGMSGIINFDIIPYNDNYLLVMLWPWMMYFFFRALTNTPWWWLAFGVAAGLSVMAKYSSLAFIIFVILTPFIFPALRRCYTHPAFWTGLVIGTSMVVPNLFWLAEHNFSAFRWVSGQISHGINIKVFIALLSVMYPLIFSFLFLKYSYVGLVWPEEPAKNALLMTAISPIVIISVWFLFNEGGRLTEWLQPFIMVLLPLMVSLVRPDKRKPDLKKAFIFFGVCSTLVLAGYVVVMTCNIKNAGKKFSGIQSFSQGIKSEWERLYGTQPLRYVGGEWLSQWLTVYVKPRPQVLNRWNDEKMPGIYNARITQQKINKFGAVVIGTSGGECNRSNFSEFNYEWPELEVSHYKQYYFSSYSRAERKRVCVGFIDPGK
ncbi:glycosyltransferase [Enterobacter sp. CGMCC 5087]|uniref:glycosyltransferase family 39 protein n=1 Tax=Enterobacter sp. CGMCC 5087 TaxID=2183878 RepID=UPI000D67A299|nr:glycosyltransferase family 39 protein [Enterobacter sp. CGMCC 5087]PWI77133.1 glycosyltransferase [Enterobacter sp. CGMCC 5087]